jgi:hypothetical protein
VTSRSILNWGSIAVASAADKETKPSMVSKRSRSLSKNVYRTRRFISFRAID